MGRKRSGLERLVGGLATGAVIATLWYAHILPAPAALVLGLFFGLFPVLGGLKRAVGEMEDRRQARIADREQRKTAQIEREESLEKVVLRIAKDRRGVVTPALVVLHSDLQLAEAEKVLGDLAARGYAEMRIKDNGTIDYVFHDLA